MSDIATAVNQQELETVFISQEFIRVRNHLEENINRIVNKMRDLTGYEEEAIKDNPSKDPVNWTETMREQAQILAEQARRVEFLADEFSKFI